MSVRVNGTRGGTVTSVAAGVSIEGSHVLVFERGRSRELVALDDDGALALADDLRARVKRNAKRAAALEAELERYATPAGCLSPASAQTGGTDV
jgi:hypothetical protein